MARSIADDFAYPTHLRAQAEALPDAPGVYFFHSETVDLPLYIGKSVSVRSRVMSHLRNPDEASMLAQTTRISFERAAGEIGALLREAQLIKTLQPLFNKRLRRNRALCSLQWHDDKLHIVQSSTVDFAHTKGLYGLFGSRHSAIERIHTLADENKLCLARLGLERLQKGRACFRYGVRLCAGACTGQESAEEHDARLLAALTTMQVLCWPFDGPVAIAESFDGLTQLHVVQNWCYLGSAGKIEEARQLSRVSPKFDADGYKVLAPVLLRGEAEIIPLGD